jgi:thymidylate synthase
VANGRLDLQLYQRSADIALGVPYNIASYSAMLMMVAQECSLTPGVFTHTIGDAHIYLNHIDGLKEQLTRTPHHLPALKIAKKPFWELKFEDFEVTGYEHDEFIKFPIAV